MIRYAACFEERGISAEELLQAESDEVLMDIGIHSEVSRKYLFLQVTLTIAALRSIHMNACGL